MAAHPPPTLTGGELITLVLNRDFGFFVSLDAVLVWLLVSAGSLFFVARVAGFGVRGWRRFEIDEAQFGLGEQKITLRPNDTDRQIAYKVWVELSTRKIGLPIDLDDDVIAEVYES